jgi:hypothetical protein
LVGIEISAVDNKKALNEFVELPFAIYRNDPHWVPPLRIAVKELLDRKKHPFYTNAEAEFFLARQGGTVVGRVAAIVDRNHNRAHNAVGARAAMGFRQGRHVPSRPGEPVHQLRMRHAGGWI